MTIESIVISTTIVAVENEGVSDDNWIDSDVNNNSSGMMHNRGYFSLFS